jgi:hypothetical protein
VKKRAQFQFKICPNEKERADHLMEELTSLVEKPQPVNPRSNLWISEGSWRLMDSKSEARRCGNVQKADQLKILLRLSLRADRKSWIDKTAVAIESLLVARQVKAAYGLIHGWYRDKSGHVPKPTIQDEEKTR